MLTQQTIELPGITMAYLEAGPLDGPLAVVLHGFPDSAESWRPTLERLGRRGFHAVAPWLRGYAPTTVPADGRYQSGAFVRDITGLHDALGGDERAVLAGHDIGAAIAYGAAAFAPKRWSRLVTVSVPPLPILAGMLATYAQLRRSWYTFVFQHPHAETLVAADNLAFVDHLWADWSPGFTHGEAVRHAKAALSDPTHMRAALGWYRAGMHPEFDDPDLAAEQAATTNAFDQPWLYLHGALDQCVGVEAARLVPHGRIIDSAGHFPHLEQPDAFHAQLDEFLLGTDPGA